ncbi:MAG TPA: hypothetical protein VFD30_11290 [Terriglobia bacterium]|nr:hypothetical protein [Terriglobia bacterium]
METVEKPQYVLTEARLRACRANLEKARAAPRAVRARMTEKRLAACRANLEKARLAPRKRRPAGLRHSIEASLAAAGERLEDFHEHWRRFLRVFCPGKESESRLVRGMAEAAWRRLRVFRWQAQRETRALARVLSGLAGRATDHPLAPSLARRGAGVGTEERSRDIQTRLPGKEEGVRARVVVLGVLEVLRRSAGMWRRVYRLNRRMACLVRLVLILKLVNPEALNQWRIGPKTEERVFLLPDRLLGNPFVSRGPRGGSRNERAAGCGRVRSDRGPEFVARKAPEIRSEAELRELFQQALGALDSEERELVGRMAGTAWRRLELFRERAKREAEELARLLEAVAGESSACGSSPSEEGGQGTQSVPRPSEQKTGEDAGVAAGREPGKRRLLWLTEKERLKGAAVGMLRVFGEEWETQEAACELERELVGLLGEWVGRREAKVRVGMEGAA